MLEDRYTEIEKANRILFERIAKINEKQNTELIPRETQQSFIDKKGARFNSVSKA
jgi:hypothetical protein